jgi:transitional endoplasmic reticulum ATPase
LRNACVWLRREASVGTENFIQYLREQDMASNVEIEEVAKVCWSDLQGVDEVIQALEAKIALPFENDVLAAELSLKPKRGVLLAGPPGTGKTTIGRALAHRLKSKFFLIDGTMIAGSHDFYSKIHDVFESAKRNAPSIIFIDDADVIFEGEKERGLCRYLLTMLDGLESASSERVCVMMTAMEPGNLPAAVLRSGRVELWLEMRLPDEAARAVILRGQFSQLPALLREVDVDAVVGAVASASSGLTGADLKAVVEDGKLLFAYDKAHGKTGRPLEEYFLEAIETIRSNRRNYVRRKPSPQMMETVKIGFTIE